MDAISARTPLRVLVVEDNSDAAESTALLVGMWGHSARVAPDGRTALDLAASFNPEVVLLDIGLPGMDGLEVARRLRREYTAPRRPWLVGVSGWGRADEHDALECGFDRYYVKPIDPEVLRDMLESRASERRQEADADNCDPASVVELQLLLESSQAAAFESAAGRQGLTAAQALRGLVRDFIRRHD